MTLEQEQLPSKAMPKEKKVFKPKDMQMEIISDSNCKSQQPGINIYRFQNRR